MGEAPEFAEEANFGEDGKLVVQELEVKGKGITVYDRATGQPKCVFVENDAVRSEQGACDNNAEQNSLPLKSASDTASFTPEQENPA